MHASKPEIVELHAASAGNPSAVPLLILHGLFGSSSNWRRISSMLGEQYHVICLDLRNHGRSPWCDSMDYASMAADVAYFIETHLDQLPILLGHSMGGKTAMYLAQNQLAALRGLVVADIAPVAYSHSHETFLQSMNAVDFTLVERRSDVDQQLALTIPEAPVRQFLLQNLEHVEGRYQWRINLPVIENSMAGLLDYDQQGIYDRATLFIAGAASDYILTEYQPTIRQLFPDSRIESIADAGHWLHVEQPVQFIRLIREFAAGLT